MASSAFTKLIRNRSQSKSITQKISIAHLTTTSSAASHHPLFFLQPPQIYDPPKPQHPDPCVQFGIYPAFSFQHFLNPVPPPFVVEEVDDVAAEDPNMIWADSVKKKRKKKMNKHKLKKLKKRLRRKTKK